MRFLKLNAFTDDRRGVWWEFAPGFTKGLLGVS